MDMLDDDVAWEEKILYVIAMAKNGMEAIHKSHNLKRKLEMNERIAKNSMCNLDFYENELLKNKESK